MTRTVSLLGLLTLTLLTACTGTQSVPTASVNAERFGQVALVPLQAGDTPESVARALGGTVLEWNDCATGDCTALVGLNAPVNGQLGAQSLRALGGRSVHVEHNRNAFGGSGTMIATMGGKISMWAGGKISMWAGGKISMWAGGTYSALPENTALWQKIGLEEGQRLAPSLGAGVTVAVIDSGIDLQHPAFQDALSAPNTWQDFYSADGVPQEEGVFGEGAYGHGTNVAGIVLQVAPAAKIMPLRVLGADGSGDVVMVAQAIDWAVDHGADVINLSLGSTESSKVVDRALERAAASGVLVVSSAGNENTSPITYPASAARRKGLNSSLVSVGSVDLNDVKSSFSNYASELEMVAPGESVYAPAPDGQMAAWSGTSMAAPMVTGSLALAIAEGAKTSELAKKITEKAQDVYKDGLNASYKDKLGDKGRLDLPAFLKETLD
ncbi:S8 family serine peptidase [Deinococcus knuensis]|uniref:Serine protease n=1 Tax=Deinococcus knuensis TaxID=1837380 RepID=A0ABQ2SRC5_9DEIO|nr:S8 family serine peptidase [Deinococcus knuensis]GGS35527.1 serine protease [Deinococcus knuensis]